MCIRDSFKNAVDYMFDGLERRSPQHFAVRQYKKYKLASGKTAKSLSLIHIFLLMRRAFPRSARSCICRCF